MLGVGVHHGGTLLPEYNLKSRKLPFATTLILVEEDWSFNLYELLGNINCIFLIDSGSIASLVPSSAGLDSRETWYHSIMFSLDNHVHQQYILQCCLGCQQASSLTCTDEEEKDVVLNPYCRANGIYCAHPRLGHAAMWIRLVLTCGSTMFLSTTSWSRYSSRWMSLMDTGPSKTFISWSL